MINIKNDADMFLDEDASMAIDIKGNFFGCLFYV